MAYLVVPCPESEPPRVRIAHGPMEWVDVLATVGILAFLIWEFRQTHPRL